MRRVSMLVAVLAVLVAAPAFADDGNVPASTLKALGLEGVQVMQDTESNEIRGMSSSAFASSLSVFSAVIADPNSGATFVFASSDFSNGTAENAGLSELSLANAGSAAASLSQSISITTNGATFSAVFGAVNVSGSSAASGD